MYSCPVNTSLRLFKFYLYYVLTKKDEDDKTLNLFGKWLKNAPVAQLDRATDF